MLSSFKVIWGLILIVSAIGGLLAYEIFIPRVSISPYETIDPKDPFETIFILENKGRFPLYKITSNVELLDILYPGNINISNSRIISSVNDADVLKGGRQTVIEIGIENAIGGLPDFPETATIETAILYQPIKQLPWKWEYRQKFSLRYDKEKQPIWAPVAQ